MTPKEKSQNLVEKFIQTNGNSFFAKECALIAVDEVISNIEPSVSMDVISARIKYWEQVKNEIESL
jgi:hypothetical protein